MDENEFLPFSEHGDYYMIEVQTATGWAPFMDASTGMPVAYRTIEGADEEAAGISGFKPLAGVRVLHVVHSEDIVREYLGGKLQ